MLIKVADWYMQRALLHILKKVNLLLTRVVPTVPPALVHQPMNLVKALQLDGSLRLGIFTYQPDTSFQDTLN